MTSDRQPGLSGIRMYVPRPRVALESWCEWTDARWDKVGAVVGDAFRLCGPQENAYTMAANAVLDLIEHYDVDPNRVGYLGFGTESSTDNAAGAVIVKGMVDDALVSRGCPPLSRECEVPEFKHACLGGMYALKHAVRYLRSDGDGRVAIAVCSDVAQYERGSSGEPTQGAGAVAMLVEPTPRLLSVDLDRSGHASQYRGIDFRKPMARHFMPEYGATPDPRNLGLRDFPVFNGKYSTVCYVDAVVHALESMFGRIDEHRLAFFHDLAALLMHRPYDRLPQQAAAAVLLWSAARQDPGDPMLADLSERAGVPLRQVLEQIQGSPSLFSEVKDHGPDHDPVPAARAVAKELSKTPVFREFVADKLGWGRSLVRELGNLYTASLPAWIAATLEDAHHREIDLTGRTILAVGYGSGDAAAAIPMRVCEGWTAAAQRLGVQDALADGVDLERAQYEALHDGRTLPGWEVPQPRGFSIDDVGRRHDPQWQDIGIEYYRFGGVARV